MANGSRRLDDCRFLYRYGRGHAQDGKSRHCIHYSFWSCERVDRNGHYCDRRACSTAERHRCCPGILWVDEVNLRHCCWYVRTKRSHIELFTDKESTVSIYLVIYSNRLTAYLPQEITPAVEAAGLPASSLPDLFAAIANGTQGALLAVPGADSGVLDALALATKHAYAHAMKIVYLTTLAFTGIGLAASFFIKDVNAYLTNYVNKTLHKPTLGNTEKVGV